MILRARYAAFLPLSIPTVATGTPGGIWTIESRASIPFNLALIQDPKIIFLDEPTSNLDPAAARMVKDLISALANKADKTIFIYTHLLDAAEELCDQIGIIDKGELKVEGSPQEIIDSVSAKDLEDAYLKIMGVSKVDDLLAWREETPEVGKKSKKMKKKKRK